jgi:hypothetical protein
MITVQAGYVETTATAYTAWLGRSSKTTAGFEKATLHKPQFAATGPKRLSGCDNLIIQNLGGSRILRRPINVTMEMIDNSFVASFSLANIDASGDTRDEALFNLASLIDDLWQLFSENSHCLGPGPSLQYAVLQQHISA